MSRRHLAILPLALLGLAAAPAPKPAAKAPSAKAAPAKPAAAKAGPYDAQNPQNLLDLLTEAGAKTAASRRDGDTVFVTVTSAAANFSLQFAGCNPQGRACQAVLFDTQVDSFTPNLAQLNSFNQTSVVCRLYQDRAGRTHATYATLVLKSDNRESARTHLAAWQGCLAESRDFARDPVAYLADAA
jgi:hypothetical protein